MTEAKAVVSNYSSPTQNLEGMGLSEESFRLVLDTSPDGFTILRSVRDAAGAIADFRIEYVNPVAARGSNREPEALVGQQLLQLFPECKPSGIFDRYVAVAETGISDTFEAFYHSPDLTGWFRNVVVSLSDAIAVSFSNITDRKQAELALQQQEQHFRLALQTAELGSWEHDLVTGVLTGSAQCKANFGLPPDAEFTHETLFALLHPEDRSLVQAAIERCIQLGTDYEVEERCYHPDGSLHWLIVRGQLVYDANGAPVRLVGVTLDITEQKQFEESLKAANQRISNILESITDSFVAFDHDWRYTYVNHEAARMLGRSPEELLGRRWQDVFPEIARKDTATIRALHQAMSERVAARLETFALVSQRWVEVSVFPSSDGVAACFRDISDRKRAEQRRDTQYAIAHILAEATTVAEATPAVLQALCENLGWQVGILWAIAPDQSLLRCLDCWQAPGAEVQEFVATNQQLTFARGVGLPGRVWASRQPFWLTEISQDSNFPRAVIASESELCSAFGFPIQLSDEVLGIIECFSDRFQEPDADLLQMMTVIGSQMGQFMERKRTEMALQESQALFQSFMNYSPILAFIKDEAGRYLYVNDRVEQVNQRQKTDFIGKTDFEILPPAIAQQFHENDQAVLTSGQPGQTLETIQHPDGEHSYMSFKFPFRNLAGQQLLAGVSIDVTERIQVEAALRQRETELRLVTNAVPVLISFIDTEQRYRFNNQRYEEWFGRPTSEVNGKYLWEVLGETVYATLRPYVKQVLAGQGVTFENRILHSPGVMRDVIVTYVPRFDPQGKVEGFVALVNDITQRKQAEATLRQSEERLRIAQQAANAGVWDWDLETNQVVWSEEHYRLYGLDPVVTQPSYNNWLAAIIEADRDRADRAVREALAQQIDLNVEVRILHPTQGERWLTTIGQTFYDDQGRPKRMTGIALDITKRKQIEENQRESEARFQAIVRNLPGMIYRYVPQVDGFDAFTYVSSGARELLELTPETILQDANAVWSLVHPEDLPSLQQSVKMAVDNLLPWQWEGRLITPSGQLKWIQGRSRPEQTECGVVWDGLLLDITERRQAEQALRESEEWARLAIQVGRLGGWRLHLDTNLVEMDQRMREIWGEPEDVVMIPLPQVIERMHPDDRDRVAQSVSEAIAPQSSGTYEIEYRIVWNDGSERWVLAKGQAQFAGEGDSRRAVDFFGTLLDITDRKQTEESLRNSAERLNLAMTAARLGDWSWEAATDLVTFSPQATAMFGTASSPAITWTQLRNLLHPDDREPARLQVEQAIAAHSNYDIEYRVRHDDGTERWIAAKGRAQYDLSGQVLGMLGVVQDITARKQAEAEREQLLLREQAARAEAEQANRIKDEFLAVLSHELRSPLNPILGWVKLLQTRSLDVQKTKHALESIERNAKLQTELIEDLLDVSRILQGKLVLNSAIVNLVSTIEAALETVKLAAEAKGIQIQKTFDPSVGQVKGDYARLQQIIWNLLSNAVKFTPSGGMVEIRLESVGDQAQIQVMDTGKGINPQFLPYVFEYFRQEDGTTTRKFGGLGLGLAIVRHLTELHGGSVGVESPGEGLGATFTVRLPLLVRNTSPNLKAQDLALHTPQAALPLPLVGCQILVVDDEPDIRDIVSFILEQAGASVRIATSALEALDLLKQSLPDILVCDIGMPNVDGYMLMRQVRMLPANQGGTLPAIALTAYAGEVDQQQALAAGFQRHMAKPVEPEELVKAIAALVKVER